MANEKKRKDNSRKNHREHEAWLQRKRAGRPKQHYVSGFVEATGQPFGYWEKTGIIQLTPP